MVCFLPQSGRGFIDLSASHNGGGSRVRGFVTASAGVRGEPRVAARHFQRSQPLISRPFPCSRQTPP